MDIRDIIIYTCLIIFVLYITRINNMWGVSKSTKKAKVDVRFEKARVKKIKRTTKLLSFLTWVDRNIGTSLSVQKQKDYDYKISRLRLVIKVTGKSIKAVELSGLFKTVQLLGVFFGLVGFLLTGNIVLLGLVVFIFTPAFFHTYAHAKISDEDALIEQEFPDLYVVLYSRLVQGTSSRLSPTLTDYLISLDSLRTKDASKVAIRNFVKDLRNNIDVYGDDILAIMKLRDKYTSVMIVNFCNLAIQALNGVDNSDKLLAFKIELNGKRIEYMKERAEKMVQKGRLAVNLVYVILFEFILLSWLAKLTQAGGVGGILGM